MPKTQCAYCYAVVIFGCEKNCSFPNTYCPKTDSLAKNRNLASSFIKFIITFFNKKTFQNENCYTGM